MIGLERIVPLTHQSGFDATRKLRAASFHLQIIRNLQILHHNRQPGAIDA